MIRLLLALSLLLSGCASTESACRRDPVWGCPEDYPHAIQRVPCYRWTVALEREPCGTWRAR